MLIITGHQNISKKYDIGVQTAIKWNRKSRRNKNTQENLIWDKEEISSQWVKMRIFNNWQIIS